MKEITALTEQLLLEHFAISLETDALKTFSPEEWQTFTQTRNLNGANGLFLPHSMTAYVKEDDLQSLLHEHLGHRVYFENSWKGIQLRKHEDELAQIERLIVGELYDEIGDSTSITFTPANVLDPVIQHNEDHLQVSYNPNFPLAQSHLQLSTQVLQQRKQIEPFAEAFADWMAQYLAKHLDLDYNPEHTGNLYDELCRAQKDHGPLTAYYLIDGKRSHQPDKLQQILEETYGENLDNIELIIKYGSDNSFSDMDFLFVMPEEKKDELENISKPKYLDIAFTSVDELKEGLKFRDIHYTIPIIEGLYLKGGERQSEFKKITEKNPLEEEYAPYLKQRFAKAKDFAQKCFAVYLQERKVAKSVTPNMLANISRTLTNITYGETYKIMLKNINPQIIPTQDLFNEIFKESKLLRASRAYLKELGKNPALFDERKVYTMLKSL